MFLILRKCLRNVIKYEFPSKGKALHLLEDLFKLLSPGLPSLLMVPHRLVQSGVRRTLPISSGTLKGSWWPAFFFADLQPPHSLWPHGPDVAPPLTTWLSQPSQTSWPARRHAVAGFPMPCISLGLMKRTLNALAGFSFYFFILHSSLEIIEEPVI